MSKENLKKPAANTDWDLHDDGSATDEQVIAKKPPVVAIVAIAPPVPPVDDEAELKKLQSDALSRMKATAPQDAEELEMPTDFQGALELVKKLENELKAAMRGPFYSRSEVRAADAKCIPISEHLALAQKNFFDIQQGNRPVAFGSNHQAAVVAGKRARPGRVADELKRLVEFRAGGRKPIFPSPRVVGNPLALMPFERLFAEESFQSAATTFNERFVDYSIAVLEADDLLNPSDALEVLRMALANSTDIAEIKQINERITAATGAINDSESAIAGTKAALRRIYGPVKDALFDALIEARDLLTGYLDEAVAAEESFFQSVELPREQTSLTRIHEAALAKINAEISSRDGSVGQAYVARQIPGIKQSELELIFNLEFTY